MELELPTLLFELLVDVPVDDLRVKLPERDVPGVVVDERRLVLVEELFANEPLRCPEKTPVRPRAAVEAVLFPKPLLFPLPQ